MHASADRKERRRHDHHRPGRVPAIEPPEPVQAARAGAGRDGRRSAREDDRHIRRMKRLTLLLAAASAAPALAHVPVEIAPTGHATVPVEGSFGVRQFVFDTGAEGSAVYADFAESAGLSAAGAETLQGQTGAAEVPLVHLAELRLDGVRKAPVDVVKLGPRADGVPLAGIVGLDLFGDRIVDFDLPRRRIGLLDARPAGLPGSAVGAAPTTGNLLTVPVTIGTV